MRWCRFTKLVRYGSSQLPTTKGVGSLGKTLVASLAARWGSLALMNFVPLGHMGVVGDTLITLG
jgi:hypothetical protein